MVIYELKPFKPSQTLAYFLYNNTAIPVELWSMILNMKYDYEKNELYNIYEHDFYSHKLRSKNLYISNSTENTLQKELYTDGFRTAALSTKRKLGYFKEDSKMYHRILYNMIKRFLNFLGKWHHYLNKISHQSSDYGNLVDVIINTTGKLMQNIQDLKGTSIYKNKAINICKKINRYLAYTHCNCDNNLWDITKCQACIDFEQEFYNNEDYLNNFIVLRNNKKIRKINTVYKPITILNVYQLC